MPSPSPTTLKGFAMSAVPMMQNPQIGQKLAAAISEVIGSACADFVRDVFVEPGIPCSVTPPAMVGTVAGVGKLSGNYPSEALIKSKAMSVIASSGMTRPGQASFAEIVSSLTAKGLSEFSAYAQLLPGTAIANSLTVAPGRLTAPTQSINTQLEILAKSMMPRPGAGPSVSELPSDFPQIVAKVLKSALEQMVQMVIVAPGIPVAGSATVGPGRLS